MTATRAHPALEATARLIVTIGAACVVAWVSYLLVLFSLDHLLGIQQLSHQLMVSRRQLLQQTITMIRQSAWLVVPVVSLSAGIIVAINANRIPTNSWLATAAGVSLLLASLIWLQFSLLHIVPFIIAFITAMVVVHLISRRKTT